MPNVLENNPRLHWRMTRMDATVRVSRIDQALRRQRIERAAAAPLDVPLKRSWAKEVGQNRQSSRNRRGDGHPTGPSREEETSSQHPRRVPNDEGVCDNVR